MSPKGMEGPGRDTLPVGSGCSPGGRMGRNGRERLDPLEGDVVVEGHDGFRNRPRRRSARRAHGHRRGAVRWLGVGLAAEHPQALGDDLGGVAVLAVVALPLAGLKAALEVDQGALLQELRGDLGDLAEQSGRDNALLRRPPLRTVLATFTAHGSSLE